MIPSSGCPPWPPDHPRTLPRTGTPTPPRGARPIKVTPQRYVTPKYDWRLLQRWGISEGNLPPGSPVLFRTPALWQVYFWQIVLVSAIVIGQAGLITGLLYERR